MMKSTHSFSPHTLGKGAIALSKLAISHTLNYLSETGALVPTLQRSIENLPPKWTKQPTGFNLLKVP